MSIESLKEFFLWCSIINFGLLMFSFVLGLLFRDLVFRMHQKLFKVPEEKIFLAYYYFMGFYKILVFVFNFIPYVALQIIS